MTTTAPPAAKNLSPPPPTNRNKSALDELGEQLRSIKKLSETSDFLNSNVIELNNNTLLSAPPHSPQAGQQHQQPQQQSREAATSGQSPVSTFQQLRMDIKRNSADNKVTGTDGGGPGSVQPAAYTSLFSPTYNQPRMAPASSSPASKSHQLRKQQAAQVESDLELPMAAIDRLPMQQVSSSGKRMGAFAPYAPHKPSYTLEDDEEIDEDDEDDLDERLPFNSSLSKLRPATAHRKMMVPESPEMRKSCSSLANTKQQLSIIAFDDKCDYAKRNKNSSSSNNNNNNKQKKTIKHHQQQAKISMGNSRPPSFNACQPSYVHLSNNSEMIASKLDWQHQHHQQHPYATRCDCTSCYKKYNSLVESNYPEAITSSTKYPKTYSMHMVLKSIILILATLLLSMLFLGVIMATHYMPHAVERLLNTPRTFNVTIATG